MTKPTLIITHDGQAHADEIFSCALIRHVFGDIPVKRTRDVSKDQLDDPNIWVLDQCGEYDTTKHNFDHHHNKDLEATNVLVLDYLRHKGLVSKDLEFMLRKQFLAISEHDRKGPTSFNGFQVGEMFRAFNNLENGFDTAVYVASQWLLGTEILLSNKKEAETIFKDGTSIGGIVRVCSRFPVFWYGMGTECILVAPDNDLWKVHSADTANYPIIPTGKEVFLHANKFIATYRTKEDAVVAATVAAKITSLTQLAKE